MKTIFCNKQLNEIKSNSKKHEIELESCKADVSRLMDILYGIDKAKEYAKIDLEKARERKIRGYHIGPSADVVRRMYNGGKVLKQTEPNYVSEGHDEIWKTREENLVKESKNEEASLQNLAKAGLWILKGNSSQSELSAPDIPLSDQVKNIFNSQMFGQDVQINYESTNDTENFQSAENNGTNLSNVQNMKIPYYQPSLDKQTPNFGAKMTNNLALRANQQKLNKNSSSGFRMTFNKNKQ